MRYIATMPNGEERDLTKVLSGRTHRDALRGEARNGTPEAILLMELYQLSDKFPIKIYDENQLIGGGYYNLTVHRDNAVLRASFDFAAGLDSDSN